MVQYGCIRSWVKARPEDFASGFIECWNAFDAKMNSAAE